MKFCSCISCLSWSGMRVGEEGRGRGVQAKLNLMFTLSMISSSRIYLTWPVCLHNWRSIPICLPPPRFSFYHLQHFTSSSLVVYNILYLSPDLVDLWKKFIRVLPKNRIQYFRLSKGVPSVQVHLKSHANVFWCSASKLCIWRLQMYFPKPDPRK